MTDPTEDAMDLDRDAEPGVDAVEVGRDDKLLTALGSGVGVTYDALTWDDDPLEPAAPGRAPGGPAGPAAPAPTGSDDPVAALLAALRADLATDLPDGAFRIDAIDGGVPADPAGPIVALGDRRRRRALPRAAAATATAIVVVSAGGFSAAAVTAGPGTWLYPLHQAISGVGDPAPEASPRAADAARAALRRADAALAAGDVATAKAALAAARGDLPLVGTGDGRAALARGVAIAQARLAEAGPPSFVAEPDPSAAGRPDTPGRSTARGGATRGASGQASSASTGGGHANRGTAGSAARSRGSGHSGHGSGKSSAGSNAAGPSTGGSKSGGQGRHGSGKSSPHRGTGSSPSTGGNSDHNAGGHATNPGAHG
jgi:hypothetical protein